MTHPPLTFFPLTEGNLMTKIKLDKLTEAELDAHSEEIEEIMADAQEEAMLNAQLKQLDSAAADFHQGYLAMVKALGSLPESRGRAIAMTHMDTGVLWAQQTFNDFKIALNKQSDGS